MSHFVLKLYIVDTECEGPVITSLIGHLSPSVFLLFISFFYTWPIILTWVLYSYNSPEDITEITIASFWLSSHLLCLFLSVWKLCSIWIICQSAPAKKVDYTSASHIPRSRHCVYLPYSLTLVCHSLQVQNIWHLCQNLCPHMNTSVYP